MCQSSAPYRTIGKQFFTTRDASIGGLTKPVSLSIARSENREALPFLILASIVKEFFNDWCNSIPTCVKDSFWVIFELQNSTDRLVDGLLGENTIRWHLSGLNRNLHWLAYS